MKLSTQDISNISNILATASVGNIESLVIEDGIVRGVNAERTFVIISDQNVPKLPQKMGLSRLGSLKQRLDLFTDGAIIDAKETERGEIGSLDISAGRNKVQFRCTSTALIKAPKSINDTPAYSISITREELKLLLNAIKIMGGKTLTLIIKKDGTAQITMSDVTNDRFDSVLETPVEVLTEGGDTVVHYYHAEVFHSVTRTISDSDVISLVVGAAGTISAEVNGHLVVMMPKINEDSEEN